MNIFDRGVAVFAMGEVEQRPRFELPDITGNRTGWGPSGTLDRFQNLPYQQFNKTDKIGKVADWIGISQFSDRFRSMTYPSIS